eukprot:161088_1
MLGYYLVSLLSVISKSYGSYVSYNDINATCSSACKAIAEYAICADTRSLPSCKSLSDEAYWANQQMNQDLSTTTIMSIVSLIFSTLLLFSLFYFMIRNCTKKNSENDHEENTISSVDRFGALYWVNEHNSTINIVMLGGSLQTFLCFVYCYILSVIHL